MDPVVFPHPLFPDHALLDSGAGEKLERYGSVLLRRPDPQALWPPSLPPAAWAEADLTFERESDRGGLWRPRRPAPRPEARDAEPSWTIGFDDCRFIIRPTPFKHVGLFPEQAANWSWIRALTPQFGEAPRLLNLFGYTGAASIVAAKAGWSVTHVDASRTSIAWAVENGVASGLSDRALRVLADDALTFARREVRRGSRYHGILLDPPHYGRGPKGEKWQFESGIAPLLEAATALLDERAFLILSTYAIGFSPLALANLLSPIEGGSIEVGELALPQESDGDRALPAGFCARWSRGLESP